MEYLAADDAANLLGISLPTLYTYVSRGLIRSEATAGSKRVRRYRRDDVEALLRRKAARQSPETLVEGALHRGMPVLESALTLIADGRLYYRGIDAIGLAHTSSVEEVAALLWQTDTFAPRLIPAQLPAGSVAARPPVRGLEGQPPAPDIDTLQQLMARIASDDLAAYDPRPAAVARTGATILRAMTMLVSGIDDVADCATLLQRGWVPSDPAAAGLFRMAIILCADHELNVSSFTARCVASAGSTPYAVVEAGLCALRGTRHGGVTARVEAALADLAAGEVRSWVAGRIQSGQPIAGFGHVLYPAGDPRARALLDAIAAAYPNRRGVTAAIEAEVAAILGDRPTIDFALVALCHTLRLPAGTALTLFALGRTIGWIGHAIEQYATGQLIRPRATYVGPLPA